MVQGSAGILKVDEDLGLCSSNEAVQGSAIFPKVDVKLVAVCRLIFL